MRKILDLVYIGAGVVAGGCIVLITLLILAQIIGRWFGVIIPSTEDFSGYLLAAASFLALAYTFRQGGHIRVTALLRLLPGAVQQKLLLCALGLLLICVGYGAFYLVGMVYESWLFQERSQGYLAVPIWLPQLPVAVGATLFFIALVDDLWRALSGKTPSFVELED